MALSQEQRNQLPASAFALPDTREFPIPDRAHAMAAIIDSKGHAREGEVRAKVCQRFGIGCNH